MMKITVTPPEQDPDATVTSVQLERHLDGTDAYTCVIKSQNPSVQVYYGLRSQLERCNTTWLQEFVTLGGLDNLLDSLCHMIGKTVQKAFTSFSDAILQIDCISCIRAILNTQTGIRHLLGSSAATNKLIMGLGIVNTLPKKQILEMAAALCAYSTLGYERVMEGFEHFKRETNQFHKFSIVVNELKSAETVPHKTAVMTLINTLITCHADLNHRCRIRNQMIGLSLLDVINFLQREETDDDLHIQLQTFHDRKHLDEEMLRDKAETDLSSPTELVELLQSKVFGTSRMVAFVNILQDLLAIELLRKEKKDQLWDVVEQQVHHLVHSHHDNITTFAGLSPRDIDELLDKQVQVAQVFATQAMEAAGLAPTDKDQSMYDNLDSEDNFMTENKIKMRASEPDLLGDLNDLNALFPPPTKKKHSGFDPTIRHLNAEHINYKPPRISLPIANQPTHRAVPAGTAVFARSNSWQGRESQQNSRQSMFHPFQTAIPTCLMRNLKWIKIPDAIVESNKGCLWETREAIPRLEPDYFQLEQLFIETHMFNINDEIPLLSGETRLKVNLFLNRLEVEPDQLIRSLIDSTCPGISLPLLKYLNSILPCPEEMQMLKQYNGNLLDIGMAEQFLLHLMDISDYQTLVLGHLTRMEFSTNTTRLLGALKAMVAACTFILGSQDLHDLLQLVIQVGNFLNQGQFNGSAVGLHLSSLKHLKEVSSTEPNLSLLHHIVIIVEEGDEQMLKIFSEIPKLEEASKHSLEEIKNDITDMNSHLKQFVYQLSSAHPSITDIFHDFLEDVKNDFCLMQKLIAELRDLSRQTALYVCESPTTFNLQTCLQHLLTFLKDLRHARHENTLYKRQRVQARRRSDQFKAKLKHKRLALEFGKEARANSSMLDERRTVLERILAELHHGNFCPLVCSTLPTAQNEDTICGSGDTEQTTPKTQNIVTTAVRTSVKSPDQALKCPLELSRISIVGTPMGNRPFSEIYDDDLLHITPRCPVQEKVITSSANDLLEKLPVLPTFPKHKQIQRLQHHLACPVGLIKGTPQQTLHHRSRSDLTDSVCLPNKWLKYEEIKRQEKRFEDGAPIAVMESSLTVATLNLEDGRSRKKTSDLVMPLCAGPIVCLPQGASRNKKDYNKDKKTGIGSFLSKISRAVLRPRNTAVNVEGKIYSKPPESTLQGKTNVRALKTIHESKENVGLHMEEKRKHGSKKTHKLVGVNKRGM